jgi:anti-sigma B factor antagonist
MDQDFEVTEKREGGLPVLAVSGEVDVATRSALQAPLDACIDAGESTLVVDLRAVTFIDSTGLAVLVAALKRCREAGGDLRLVADSPRLLQLLAITGLDQTFSVSESPGAAVQGTSAQD